MLGFSIISLNCRETQDTLDETQNALETQDTLDETQDSLETQDTLEETQDALDPLKKHRTQRFLDPPPTYQFCT